MRTPPFAEAAERSRLPTSTPEPCRVTLADPGKHHSDVTCTTVYSPCYYLQPCYEAGTWNRANPLPSSSGVLADRWWVHL
jgi:hypothetical protein